MPKAAKKAIDKAVQEALEQSLEVKEEAVEQQFVLVGNLSEAKFDAEKRTAELTVIRKGWSQNGFYYGDQALESISNFLNTTAERVFLNHNKRSEIFEPRLVEDHIGNNVVARVAEDGNSVIANTKFFESGPNAWTFERMRETPHTFGPSIVGKAKIRRGEAEGRKGPIVDNVTFLHSFDMVATPAAGGKVNSVSENENVCPTDGGCSFVHESIELEKTSEKESSDDSVKESEQESDTVENIDLKAKLLELKALQKARDDYWNLEMVFTRSLHELVFAHGDYQFMSPADRKKLVKPLLTNFETEVMKIPFVPAKNIPQVSADVAQAATVETDVDEGVIRIVLHGKGTFVKNSFKKVTISKENGVTAITGKHKESKRASTVRSYEFDTTKGWSEATAKQWISQNVKSETKPNTNTKEGVELMFENLAELKLKDPTLYSKLIAEAQSDHDAAGKVAQWKKDSMELSTVKEDLSAVNTERDSLKAENEKVTSENKELKEANIQFAEVNSAARKRELILEVKTAVGLAEEFCSEPFNKLLESLEFDSAKEDAFKTAITEHVEDRKTLIGEKVSGGVQRPGARKVIESAGISRPKITTVAEQTEKLDSKAFAMALKR